MNPTEIYFAEICAGVGTTPEEIRLKSRKEKILWLRKVIIARLHADGLDAEQIARLLCLTRTTVMHHLSDEIQERKHKRYLERKTKKKNEKT